MCLTEVSIVVLNTIAIVTTVKHLTDGLQDQKIADCGSSYRDRKYSGRTQNL